MSLLQLSDVRELEDMVITCIYNNLLGCRLDNKQQQLIVEYVASRDFRVEDAPKLFKQLNDWLRHIAEVDTKMENTMKAVATKIQDSARRKVRVRDEADAAHAQALQEHEADRARMRPAMQPQMMMPPMQGHHGQGQGYGDYGPEGDDYEHKHHGHH